MPMTEQQAHNLGLPLLYFRHAILCVTSLTVTPMFARRYRSPVRALRPAAAMSIAHQAESKT